MQHDIAGKVIVVTGAGRGIGRAIALAMAREGARVAVLTLDEDEADDTATALASVTTADRFSIFTADVTDEAQVREVAGAVDQAWGRVDALVNNAGFMPNMVPVVDLDLDLLRRVIDVNLIGYFLTTKHFAPIMVRGGGGRIVYMSSMIGVQANPGQSAYGASKAGVNVLSNVVHREMADQGIRTAAIAPGLTDTPGMRAVSGDEYVARVAAAYPGGRVGQPEDVVAFVLFLCSDAAQHISGTLLPIRPVGG